MPGPAGVHGEKLCLEEVKVQVKKKREKTFEKTQRRSKTGHARRRPLAGGDDGAGVFRLVSSVFANECAGARWKRFVRFDSQITAGYEVRITLNFLPSYDMFLCIT